MNGLQQLGHKSAAYRRQRSGQPTAKTANKAAFKQNDGGDQSADCANDDVLCVGLVTDVGEVDDKSFNQSAWEGVKTAERELGAQIEYVETKDAKDYATNIALFGDQGFQGIEAPSDSQPGGQIRF